MSSFPNKIWGSYGDEKATSSTKGPPLGTGMELPDGSKFRYARAGGTALVAGNLIMGVTEVDSDRVKELAVATAAAVGDTSITLTNGGTAMTTNLLTDGYIFTNDEQGQGIKYRIKACGSAAASASVTFELEDGDPVQTALLAGSSVCGLRQNAYDLVVIYKGGTIGASKVGVAPIAVTADSYFWLQTRGECAVLTAATVMSVGAGMVGSVETDGAVKAWLTSGSAAADTEEAIHIIGYSMAPAATAGDYGLVFLTLE